MAASLDFYAGQTPVNVASSGLGFFGDSGFGASITVGAWQGRTFIASSNGASQGPESWNTKYLSLTGVIIGQSGSGLGLNQIPNAQAPLNMRFTYDTPVKVQNARVYLYDRTSTGNAPSGVTTAVYEVVHPGTGQTPDGSGGPFQTGTPHKWCMFPGGTPTTGMPLSPSPGSGGLSPSGANTVDTRHDFYLAISSSPDSIGAKTNYGLYAYLEYL